MTGSDQDRRQLLDINHIGFQGRINLSLKENQAFHPTGLHLSMLSQWAEMLARFSLKWPGNELVTVIHVKQTLYSFVCATKKLSSRSGFFTYFGLAPQAKKSGQHILFQRLMNRKLLVVKEQFLQRNNEWKIDME